MLFSTLALSLLSALVFSFGDSTGVFYRNEGFTLLFIGQFFAYALCHKKKNELKTIRIKLSVSIISMLYFLSFVSKITTSGFLWFTQVTGFANHILKSKLYEYSTSGNLKAYETGYQYYDFILQHQLFFGFLLFCALVLEGFIFLSTKSHKIAFWGGLGLLGMHIGIYFLMDIFIVSIVLPMVLFILNVPAIIISLSDLFFKKVANE